MAGSDLSKFRFRAAAALDLRLEHEAAAAAAFGQAEAAFRRAEAAQAGAQTARERAWADCAAAERRGTDVDTLVWHRNWIVRLGTSVAESARIREARLADVANARRLWELARRRRLALEKMRDRALARFTREQHRRDAIAMDEIARLRYVSSDVWRTNS